MQSHFFKKGFSIVELLISVAIIGLIAYSISLFQSNIFSLNYTLQSSLNAQFDAKHLIKVMVSELRKTARSASGGYPIELASTTTITFYSDIDSDGSSERIRYFVSGSYIKKGVIKATGNPPVYNAANETVTTLFNYVVASSTLPVFQYYPSSYSGTSSPLTYPMNIPSIRLVKINIIIDSDPNKSPIQLVVTSSVSLRNLKDNL